MSNQTHILNLVKKLMIKILNLELVVLLEYQNVKGFLQTDYVPSWSEELFGIKKYLPSTYVISDLKGVKNVGTFYQKKLQKSNQKELRVKKVIKRKRDKLYVKWKGYESFFNGWIDKKT